MPRAGSTTAASRQRQGHPHPRLQRHRQGRDQGRRQPLAERARAPASGSITSPPASWSPRRTPRAATTIFDQLADEGLPRVVTVGRLDINTEGLLLLTNDGGLKRVLELPATGWLRRYRVRAFGKVTAGSSSTSSRTASRSTASNTVRSKPRSSASRATMSGCSWRSAKARTARSRTSSPRSASR